MLSGVVDSFMIPSLRIMYSSGWLPYFSIINCAQQGSPLSKKKNYILGFHKKRVKVSFYDPKEDGFPIVKYKVNTS